MGFLSVFIVAEMSEFGKNGDENSHAKTLTQGCRAGSCIASARESQYNTLKGIAKGTAATSSPSISQGKGGGRDDFVRHGVFTHSRHRVHCRNKQEITAPSDNGMLPVKRTVKNINILWSTDSSVGQFSTIKV